MRIYCDVTRVVDIPRDVTVDSDSFVRYRQTYHSACISETCLQLNNSKRLSSSLLLYTNLHSNLSKYIAFLSSHFDNIYFNLKLSLLSCIDMVVYDICYSTSERKYQKTELKFYLQ